MNIESMCSDAKTRVTHAINRSAGQHIRAMRKSPPADAPSDADIYAMAMESDTAYRFAPWLCKQAGINFPPQQTGVVCQSLA